MENNNNSALKLKTLCQGTLIEILVLLPSFEYFCEHSSYIGGLSLSLNPISHIRQREIECYKYWIYPKTCGVKYQFFYTGAFKSKTSKKYECQSSFRYVFPFF